MDQRSEMQTQQEAVTKYFKFIITLVEEGTDALRCLLQKQLSDDDLATIIERNRDVLQDLLHKKVLTPLQLELLQKVPPNPSDFDISLLMVVLRHFCENIQAPAKGWNVKDPDPDDHSTGAELLRIRQIRNHSAHLPSPELVHPTFETLWNQLVCTIVRITLSISNEKTAAAIRKIGEIENMEINPTGTTEKAAFQTFKNWQKQTTDIIQDKLESLERSLDYLRRKIESTESINAAEANTSQAQASDVTLQMSKTTLNSETIMTILDDIRDIKQTGACTKDDVMDLKRQLSEVAKDVSSICSKSDYKKITEAAVSSLQSLSSCDRYLQSKNEAIERSDVDLIEGLTQEIKENKELIKNKKEQIQNWEQKVYSINVNAPLVSVDHSSTTNYNISGGTQHIGTK